MKLTTPGVSGECLEQVRLAKFSNNMLVGAYFILFSLDKWSRSF